MMGFGCFVGIQKAGLRVMDMNGVWCLFVRIFGIAKPVVQDKQVAKKKNNIDEI